MSPIYKLCLKHRALYQGKCPACYRADNQRRARKQQATGRTTERWRRLKKQAKENAGYRCQVCGVPEAPTPAGWLDVHLRDRSRSHSDSTLTVADLIVTCKSHHGAYHAAEAQGAGWHRERGLEGSHRASLSRNKLERAATPLGRRAARPAQRPKVPPPIIKDARRAPILRPLSVYGQAERVI